VAIKVGDEDRGHLTVGVSLLHRQCDQDADNLEEGGAWQAGAFMHTHLGHVNLTQKQYPTIKCFGLWSPLLATTCKRSCSKP